MQQFSTLYNQFIKQISRSSFKLASITMTVTIVCEPLTAGHN